MSGPIKLPDYVLCSLYKNSLVLPQSTYKNMPQYTEKSPKEETNIPALNTINIIGKNTRNVLILVKLQNTDSIPSHQWETLEKLIHACKLTVNDITLIPIGIELLPFSTLQQQYKPLTVLLFDVQANDIDLPFSVPDYQVQHFDNCTFVSAPILTLEKDDGNEKIKAAKKALWQALKKIFLPN